MNASIHRFLGVLAVIAVGLPTSASANAPAGQYVVTASGTGNGTVYDTKSKLTWQQTVSSATYSWVAAKTYCAGVGASLGGTGWRLPTIKELQSIVDLTQRPPLLLTRTPFPRHQKTRSGHRPRWPARRPMRGLSTSASAARTTSTCPSRTMYVASAEDGHFDARLFDLSFSDLLSLDKQFARGKLNGLLL